MYGLALNICVNNEGKSEVNIKFELFIISMNLNNILVVLSNCLISPSFVRPILIGEHKPDIISNGAKYEGLIPCLYWYQLKECKDSMKIQLKSKIIFNGYVIPRK